MTAVAFVLVALSVSQLGELPPVVGPEVPFVATPMEIVDEMLRLAAVGPNDVVYDLGCGDGRIVLRAAERHGARGVGVDVDGRLVAEATEAAARAGLASRVQFREHDLFAADLREATVVTLYLFRRMNLQLRPKLLRELPPGARVVSHQFDMGDWKPDRVVEVRGRKLYLWTVPADPARRLELGAQGGRG
jgi:SAM-dependent methyltransferase